MKLYLYCNAPAYVARNEAAKSLIYEFSDEKPEA